MRADDSSEVIGDAISLLLAQHAELALAGPPPHRRLVDWMIRFQFDNECDYFETDPASPSQRIHRPDNFKDFGMTHGATNEQRAAHDCVVRISCTFRHLRIMILA